MSEEQDQVQGVRVNEFGIVEESAEVDAVKPEGEGLAEKLMEARREADKQSFESTATRVRETYELDEKGKYITKVKDMGLFQHQIEPVLGLGSSRAYVYFQDKEGHTVVDREFGEKMVESVGKMLRGELPAGESVMMADAEYLKMEAECKRLAARVGELEEWNKKGQAALDAVKREKAELAKSSPTDVAELRKTVTDLAMENTGLLGVVELKNKRIAELEKINQEFAGRIPAPAANAEEAEKDRQEQLEKKRKAAAAEIEKRKACGFSARNGLRCSHKCAECSKCARATYKGHLIMMKCMAFGFQTWKESGCMETMAQKGEGVYQEIGDALVERWIAENKAARCVKCGKVIGWDEYAVNMEWCAECMNASWDEYLKEHPEAAAKVAAEEQKGVTEMVAAEKPKIVVEDPNALGPICVPFGGKCMDCIYWHTAHCCTPTNLKTSKAKCFTMRLSKSQRDALEATMRASAEGMVRMVEGRKVGSTTTLIDESGERVITTYDDTGRAVNETRGEDHEW